MVEYIWKEMFLVMNMKFKEGREVKDYDRKFKSGGNIGFDIWSSLKSVVWGKRECGKE